MIDALERHLSLRDLAGYGGWNTAGNTIGVALAQVALLRCKGTMKVRRCVFWHIASSRIMAICISTRPQMDARKVLYDDNTEAAMIAYVTEELNDFVRTLADFREWRVTNVRLPWKRRFEVDFDLERA